MDSLTIYGNLDCFASFKRSLEDIVKTHYFGIACKLTGEGKLLNIFFDLVQYLISHGKVAVVDFGKYLLLAQVVEGYRSQTGWKKLKFLLFGDEKGQEFTPEEGRFVIFKWGNGETFSFNNLYHDILEMWYLKGLIGWDQDKSKKRIDVEFEKNPGKDGWKEVYNSYEEGFLGIISPKNVTNQVKKWQYFEPKNTVERQQLWKELEKVESRFFMKLGIRHNPFAKEERQNNPEVTSGQSYFDAWEQKYEEGIIQGILDFQGKPWGGGKYNYKFGSLPTLLIENNSIQPLALIQQQNRWNQFNQSSPLLNNKE